jgi:hypothetical protein
MALTPPAAPSRRSRPGRKRKAQEPSPWARPAPPSIGDPLADITYRSVGEALTCWEFFEICLGRMFSAFVGRRSQPMVAVRAYGAVMSFEGRMAMVTEAARAHFHISQNRARPEDQLQADIEQLIKEAREYGARRNEIAHGIVMQYGLVSSSSWKDPAMFRSFIIGPPEYMSSRRTIPRRIPPMGEPPPELMFGVSYVYSSKEIDSLSRQFELLSKRTMALSAKIVNLWPPRA